MKVGGRASSLAWCRGPWDPAPALKEGRREKVGLEEDQESP